MPTGIETQEAPKSAIAVAQSILDSRLDSIEQVLPRDQRGEAERYVRRAMLTFQGSERLQSCTPLSLAVCVVKAAESGLAIDGKLAHAVPYSVNAGSKANPRWETHAQYQPDYRGLIAIAKRSQRIVDITAGIVCENDAFDHGRNGPTSTLTHTYDAKKPRGPVVTAYAIIEFAAGRWCYELMPLVELEKVRASSKAKDGPAWKNWPDEMRKKAVIKRALKTYTDSPELVAAIVADDAAEFVRHPADEPDELQSGDTVPRDELDIVATKLLTDDEPAGTPPEAATATPPADDKAPTPDEKPAKAKAPKAKSKKPAKADKQQTLPEAPAEPDTRTDAEKFDDECPF